MTISGWEDIRAEVLRRIRVRDWQPGAMIPNEEDLAVEFGCARATVNRALRELAAAGVVERRRKTGTRVTLHPVRKALFDIPVTRREIEARGQVYGYELLSSALAVPPEAVAQTLGLTEGQKLLHLCARHLADGAAVVFEDRWLNPLVLPQDSAPDFTGVSANEWLVENVSYSRGDIAFSAANASDFEAEILGAPIGAALFVVERHTWVEDRAVTAVRLTYAAGYRMQTQL